MSEEARAEGGECVEWEFGHDGEAVSLEDLACGLIPSIVFPCGCWNFDAFFAFLFVGVVPVVAAVICG